MNKYDKSQLHQPACVNGRRTRNYICLVDTYRRPSRQRNTAGRYRVGAKNPKAAVLVYYEDNTSQLSELVPVGECRREIWNAHSKRFDQTPVRHACEPVL